MNTLFPIAPNYPEGFIYEPDFLTAEEEQQLLNVISTITLHNFNFKGFTANRKVASFGFDYSFDNGSLSKGDDIPSGFTFIIEKVAKRLAIEPEEFAELLIIEYPPGCVMNWHRDAPPFGIIAGLSLLSDCTVRFRPQEKEKQGRGSVISVPLQRRSLYVMDGPSRSDCQHSVTPVKHTRYSITLRTLRKEQL